MEVGAVKQAFNNELILLKKKLNQAKIQIIHKLTRKAKTLIERKAPEALKEKLKRKAESAVNEVLIIKKIKPKDLARFAVTHKGQLNDHLNKPNVDQDKACARLLLHKALLDKYKLIRTRFSSIPIEDLLMSREERKKLKKEARDKQKNKRKENELKAKNVVNAEGVWEVEDVDMSNSIKDASVNEQSDTENMEDENKVEEDLESSNEYRNGNEDLEESNEQSEEDSESDSDIASVIGTDNENNDVGPKSDEESNDEEAISEEKFESPTKISKPRKSKNQAINQGKVIPENVIVNKPKLPSKVQKPVGKPKEKKPNKNKNLNEKLLSRKFKKDSKETPVSEAKIVDPFFITSTGENYMSVFEPRGPDEVKEVHKQGNRKLRRAAMFGHVPKIKPRQNNFGEDDNRFNRNNGFNKNNAKRFNDKDGLSNDKRNFTDKRNRFNREEEKEAKPEKLHPSWEAKKRQSGIQPFKGKKIVFDES